MKNADAFEGWEEFKDLDEVTDLNDFAALDYSDEDYFNELEAIQSKAPGERSVADWLYLAEFDCYVLLEQGCPLEKFTPENCLDLIVANPYALRFVAPEEQLKKIISAEDFAIWDGDDICVALACGGEWLSKYLDLSKITQEDFDRYFFPGENVTPEEYFENISDVFPRGVPEQIKLHFSRNE